MLIFDVIRKKDLLLTPEEWVRQHCIHFLLHDRNSPLALLTLKNQLRFVGAQSAMILLFLNPMEKFRFWLSAAPNVPLIKLYSIK